MINNHVVLLCFATNKQTGNWSQKCMPRLCLGSLQAMRRSAIGQSPLPPPPPPPLLFLSLPSDDFKTRRVLNIYNCSKWPLLFYRTQLQKTSYNGSVHQREFIELPVVPLQLSRKQYSSSQRQRNMFGN